MGGGRVSMLIADDHDVVRAELVRLFDGATDIRLVGEAADGVEALAMVEQHRPDVVLMDVSMPEINGFEATRAIKWRWPETVVLILSLLGDDEYVFAALAAGAAGCIVKDHAAEELVDAVRSAARRDPVLDSTVGVRVFPRFAGRRRPTAGGISALNRSQLQLLRFAGCGWSSLRIASELRLPEATVRTCLDALYRRMCAASPAEAVVSALSHGLIQPQQLVLGPPEQASRAEPGGAMLAERGSV